MQHPFLKGITTPALFLRIKLPRSRRSWSTPAVAGAWNRGQWPLRWMGRKTSTRRRCAKISES